jgi:predicted transcriptional regulator
MPNQQKPRLSELENLVMSVVWDAGQATADMVRTTLKPRQSMKESTVRTILRRLEGKGYVRHTTEGRTYVYAPTAAPRNVAADAVRGIIERFCNGSVEELLVGMVDREVVSPERLQALAKRLADHKGASVDKPVSKRHRRKRGS